LPEQAVRGAAIGPSLVIREREKMPQMTSACLSSELYASEKSGFLLNVDTMAIMAITIFPVCGSVVIVLPIMGPASRFVLPKVVC
jgi:hypothetical protein